MNQIAGLITLLTRLLFTSALALACQVVMIVKFPEPLLVIQEAVKLGSVKLFEATGLESSYRVAYNLLNGDGIVVHILFVLGVFVTLYLLFLPLTLLRPGRSAYAA